MRVNMGIRKEDYTRATLGPKTRRWLEKLRPYANKRAKPFQAAHAALLVVDMQGFFLDKRSHAFVPAGKAIVPNLRKLLDAFRKRGRPVFFTRFAVKAGEEKGSIGQWWGNSVEEGGPDSRIIPELAPVKGEIVLRKKSYDAFRGTKLEAMLREKKIDTLLIAGVLTHLCCDSTARAAFERGFRVFLPVDALASYNEELHLAALKTLAHGFAVPCATEEAVKQLEAQA